jgi:hypothetical protein
MGYEFGSAWMYDVWVWLVERDDVEAESGEGGKGDEFGVKGANVEVSVGEDERSTVEGPTTMIGSTCASPGGTGWLDGSGGTAGASLSLNTPPASSALVLGAETTRRRNRAVADCLVVPVSSPWGSLPEELDFEADAFRLSLLTGELLFADLLEVLVDPNDFFVFNGTPWPRLPCALALSFFRDSEGDEKNRPLNPLSPSPGERNGVVPVPGPPDVDVAKLAVELELGPVTCGGGCADDALGDEYWGLWEREEDEDRSVAFEFASEYGRTG